MSSCSGNINKLSSKVHIIEENCRCAKGGCLLPELENTKLSLQNHFDTWIPKFKNECKTNGTFQSFQDYIDNCKDFSKSYIIYLRQSDFDVNPITYKILQKKLGGTLRIVNSSYFILAENIVFHFAIPTQEQTTKCVSIKDYNQRYIYPVRQNNGSYDLGFFAGISVEAENVVIDFGGYNLSMSKEFYLLQRFFSIVELASSPFIPSQGPANFGEIIRCGRNIVLMNGCFGLSSHHSIHGNLNNMVYLGGLKLLDFEIAGIGLNGCENLLINNCDIGPNFRKVPVRGNMSPFIFIDRALNKLTLNSRYSFLQSLKNKTNRFVNQVKNEYLQTGKVSIYPVGNSNQLPDGLVYGIVINKKGVAVNGFSSCCPEPSNIRDLSKNIFISNTNIHDIKGNPEEVVSIANKVNGTPIVMAFGAILRLYEFTFTNGKGKYSEYYDIIFELADILMNDGNRGLVSSFSPITLYKYPEIVNWYMKKQSMNIYDVMRKNGLIIYLNADTMNHVHKGVIGLRLDGVSRGLVNDTKVYMIENVGGYGSSVLGDYKKSNPLALLEGYGGNICRGVAISGCIDMVLNSSRIERVLSKTGSAYGCDIIESNIGAYLKDITVYQVITLSNEVRLGNRWPEAVHITNYL